MTQHAVLGASSSGRWMNCPGSVRMTRDLPDVPTEYAREGTVAHKLMNLALSERLPCMTWLGASYDGIEINEEMCEAVQPCVDAVLAILDIDPDARMWLEHKFSLGVLNPPADMFGTADVVIWLPGSRTLVVADLKYGRGVAVEVLNNPQTLYYALGALLDLERDQAWRGQIRTVRTVILQPRLAHPNGMIREAIYSYDDVVAFAGDLLDLARRTLEPDAPLLPGDHCRFCRAAGACPALKSQATAVARVEFADLPAELPPAPESLPVEVLADILDKADLLEDWLKAVRAYVAGELERGHDVPGWKLVPKRAMRKWASESVALSWLRERGYNGTEVMTQPELKSVAQVERIVKAAGGGKLPDELITQQSSGTTLAPTSDPRPAAALGPAQDFADNLIES
jgi:hypothetical protein